MLFRIAAPLVWHGWGAHYRRSGIDAVGALALTTSLAMSRRSWSITTTVPGRMYGVARK